MLDGDVLVNIFINQLMMQSTKLAFFILNFLRVKSFNQLLAKCIPKSGESFLKNFRPKPNFYFSKENQPDLFTYFSLFCTVIMSS